MNPENVEIARARQVIRLLGHAPENYHVTCDRPTAEAVSGARALVIRRNGTRRTYLLDTSEDWAFELEADLKRGEFGPA